MPGETPTPAPEEASEPAAAPAPTEPAPKPVAKRAPKKAAKATSSGSKKGVKKTMAQKIEITVRKAGQKLFDCAAYALGPEFDFPSDTEDVLVEARRSFERVWVAVQEGRQVASDADDDSDAPGIGKYKKLSPPRLDSDGWILVGRVNDSGEELVLSPKGNAPYRSPRTYGDEGLSHPPVRSQSDEEAEKNDALGFPPLLGDRNIPLDRESSFRSEDVTEEKARVQATGKARQKKESGRAAPTESGAKPRSRKRGRAEADLEVEASASVSAPGIGEPESKRRREEKRPVRLRLTVKPPPSDEDEAQATKGNKVADSLISKDEKSTKGPSVGKGKKRALDLTSEAEPATKAPSKRARKAPPPDTEAPAAKKSRKRGAASAATTSKKAPKS